MMSEDNQCSLDGLDEEFRMLDINEQLPPAGGYEENKMEGDGSERSSNASDDKYKLRIECLPAEILAICLSYTGKDLSNARLTCRRFNQIIEDYQYMMNVIPVKHIIIGKDKHQDFLAIKVNWSLFGYGKPRYGRCKLDELMKYFRFLRPRELMIEDHLEATDMKKHLTDSWRKSIVALDIYKPLLSIFPNVRDLEFHYYNSSDLPSFSAQISAHPSPIRRFHLGSYFFRDLDGNALILDALSKNSNKFNRGMMDVGLYSHCSMEAIIRFLENGKFAKKFCMFAFVKKYNDPVGRNDVYVENCGYLKFKTWMRSKGIPQSRADDRSLSSTAMRRPPLFVYRSTQFKLRFENC